MPAERTTPLLDPEQIAVRAGRQMPFLRLPAPTAYADRALRLRQLAADHPMRDYLLFIAALAQAQHDELQQLPPLTLPGPQDLRAAADALDPPLPADGTLDPAWRGVLSSLLARLGSRLPAGGAAEVLARVRAAPEAWLDAQAERLLAGVGVGLDLAAAPLIAAGLQVTWTGRVLQTAERHGPAAFGRTDPATRCPCCGSRPTAGVTRIGAEESGHRYLHCSLCAAQWHYVRIKCAHCESTKGVHYEQLEAQPGARPRTTGVPREGAVRAECCDTCGHYLKLVVMERDPEVEPAADDLASVSLDLLVSEAGHERAGVNLMLLFGGDDADADVDAGAEAAP